MDGISVFQFTSTYVAGGLDGNVDLTGITDKGYESGNPTKPDTNIPATDDGKDANEVTSSEIQEDMTVTIKFSATIYSTGQAVPKWVKENLYKVIQKSGRKVLLDNIMSWIAQVMFKHLIQEKVIQQEILKLTLFNQAIL